MYNSRTFTDVDLIQLSFSPSYILQWKTDMEDILALATHDTDQWVSTIAEILQSYPSTGCLNLELDNSNSTFMEILTDLSKVGEWHSPILVNFTGHRRHKI